MIRLENVNKYFNRKKKNEIHAINNTSVQLGEKGLVTFLGNSGCGKTTLLNAIGGLDKVNSGKIFLDDQEITSKSSGRKDEIRTLNVGYIFQNFYLIEDLSVFDNVAIVLKMMGVKNKEEINKRVMYILQQVGMERYKNRPAKMLSGGERQRVGIARALVKNPKIIIADEPTGNLDSKNTIAIMNIIKAISKEKLVILVTHEREVAEFYASRIIEIVDGKIVSDRENEHENKLDYRIDNRIFLKDMPVQKEMEQDNVKIQFYSDTAEDLNIKVVVKNNNIYIKTSGDISQGADVVDIVDGHYEQLSKEVYEDYNFDFDKLTDEKHKPKYTSIFNLWTLITAGYKKIFSYSVLKKILLAGFVLASMMTIYSVSHIAGITNIEDREFVDTNQNYITVKTGKVSIKTYDKYRKMDGIEYVMPGDGNVTMAMPIDDFYQSFNRFVTLTGALSDEELVDKQAVITGTGKIKKNQVVVDRMIIDDLLEGRQVKMIGLTDYEDFIGRKLSIPNFENLEIVGIVDQSSPSLYVDKKQRMDIMLSNPGQSIEDAMSMEEGFKMSEKEIQQYKFASRTKAIELTSGEKPGDYEAVVPDSMKTEIAIGSTIKTKVGGKKLTVSGFYKSSDYRDTIYVNDRTALINFASQQSDLTICPTDKAATISKITNDSTTKVIDNYEKTKEDYYNSLKKNIIASVILAVIILIISLVEIYLMLRASFLSRIKEVGVLRAIGLKKMDIYKMFSGEIVALTTLTALPGMGVTAYMISGVCKMPGIGSNYMMNPTIFLISFGIIFVFNLIAGLMPVARVMRKTPAEILARNDVN